MKKLSRTIHLWTGLIFGIILVLEGLTGTVLSWRHELDAWLNPGLLQVAPPPGKQAGEPVHVTPELIDAATGVLEHDPRYGKPNMLMFPERAGDVFIAWYRPGPAESLWDQGVTRQVMLDPSDLRVLGERNWGESGLSRPLLMPTLFHLHRYLLAGEGGKIVIAVQGVALLLASVTGLILWWPRLSRSAIVHALTVRHGGSWPRFSFQLHRAAGFWATPVFIVLAVSGIYFNMPSWVKPVVASVSTVTENEQVSNLSAPSSSQLTPGAAVAAAQERMPHARASRLSLPAKDGQPYEVRVRQPGELRHGPGATRISIDSGDGQVLRVIDPLAAQGGDWFFSTMYPLHTGEAFGLAGRILVSVAGVMPLVFFVTGLVVWIRFRRKPAKVVVMKPVIPPGVEPVIQRD